MDQGTGGGSEPQAWHGAVRTQENQQARSAQGRTQRVALDWNHKPPAKPAGCGPWEASRRAAYLFLSLPRGITEVTGAMGRSEGLPVLGAEVSFLGFLDIFSLRCSLDINSPDIVLK